MQVSNTLYCDTLTFFLYFSSEDKAVNLDLYFSFRVYVIFFKYFYSFVTNKQRWRESSE